MLKDDVKKNYPDGLKNYNQIIQDTHRRRWAKGAWTDNTDMMLCILNGFEKGKFNISRMASNFKDWFKGEPKGIGSHTYKILCLRDYVDQPEMCSKNVVGFVAPKKCSEWSLNENLGGWTS